MHYLSNLNLWRKHLSKKFYLDLYSIGSYSLIHIWARRGSSLVRYGGLHLQEGPFCFEYYKCTLLVGSLSGQAILRIHSFTSHLNCSQEGSLISWVLWTSLPRGGLLAVTIIVKANSCPFSQIKTHHCPFTDFRKPLLQRCKSILPKVLDIQ